MCFFSSYFFSLWKWRLLALQITLIREDSLIVTLSLFIMALLAHESKGNSYRISTGMSKEMLLEVLGFIWYFGFISMSSVQRYQNKMGGFENHLTFSFHENYTQDLYYYFNMCRYNFKHLSYCSLISSQSCNCSAAFSSMLCLGFK